MTGLVHSLRAFGLLAVFSAVALLHPSDAAAQSRERPPVPARPAADKPVAGKVQLEVMVVHATNESDGIDPRLRTLAKDLAFLRYRGYTVLDVAPASLAPGQETSLGLPDDRRMRFELLSRDERAAKVRVRMFKGSEKVLDTTVSILRNRTFIVGGPNYEGGKLVVPISVDY